MISIVIPTYNEAENIPGLLEEIYAACAKAGVEVEIVVADDLSPDGTADAAEKAMAGRPGTVLRRKGPRGLAPAVVEGFGHAGGDFLGVMDADGSHPPHVLPRMWEALEREGADLAVGSRYVPGGGTEGWPLRRRVASRLACLLARPLTSVRDATSGFFLCRREVLEGVNLDARGFKIGLEVFVKGRYRKRVEVPFMFTDRRFGESKLGGRVMLHYLAQLIRLAAWRIRTMACGLRPKNGDR